MELTKIDVIALAREAGLCFPDCWFLDANPYEDLLGTIQDIRTEEERRDYLNLVAAEDVKRREKLHALECFAAAVLRQTQQQILRETAVWRQQEGESYANGGVRACNRLEWQALLLQQAHAPEVLA